MMEAHSDESRAATSDDFAPTVRGAINAWLTRVDDADYSILFGDHEESLVAEIAERVVSVLRGKAG